MKDKRDECGCHRDCTGLPAGDYILGVEPHTCDQPCVWPYCLTWDEEQELLRELREDGVA